MLAQSRFTSSLGDAFTSIIWRDGPGGSREMACALGIQVARLEAAVGSGVQTGFVLASHRALGVH
jgi:hypothetical protein